MQPGRFRRCVESLIAQETGDWGAVVVDDASTNGFSDYAEMLCSHFAGRVTVVRKRRRRGPLFNTWNAITNYCSNPESVIITLDADDALLGPHVLDNPRSRGSNVWQHLRTFRKCLFDGIAVEDLKLVGE